MTTSTQNKPPLAWRIFLKLQNPFMKWLLRSPLHFIVSRMYMLLKVTGRKSGTVYSTPVQYAQHGSTLHIITSEGYVWWKNLRGGADVQMVLRGKPCSGRAEAFTDAATIDAQIQKVYPGLSAARRAKFVPGKVALTITLNSTNSTP